VNFPPRTLFLVCGLIFALIGGVEGVRASEVQLPGPDVVGGKISGRWTGYAELDGRHVPFQLEIDGTAENVTGILVNGKERSASSSGSLSDGHLILHFDYYANTLEAELKQDDLTGTFGGHSRSIPITAHLNAKPPAPSVGAPNIAGEWTVAVQGSKGAHSWKLHVRQQGAQVVAVIQRIDGDTGSLYGQWQDGKFAVSHFTAAGPSYAELKPQSDGTLQVLTFAHKGELQQLSAQRSQAKSAEKQAAVDDPLHHTSLKNPQEPLGFRFPDLTGKLVSDTDPEFKGKAVIVSIGGSWCPNCQDEAPFLEELYQRFHGQGLDVVEVSFEEQSQLTNPSRLKAVIHRFGITYPVLLAGTPDQLGDKFPSVSNLDCWPTTFFVGRDGKVKAIHTGYSGPATGKDNGALRSEVTSTVRSLLAQRP
jgi:thiol-disulfide isomerase/thioredoxin